MALVFDGAVKTPLRVKDPLTDDKLPGIASLSWGDIASESGLGSTTGVDCVKVAGNRWYQIQGNLTENYVGDKKIDVKGKHDETILNDRNITVSSGNMARTVSAGKVKDFAAQNHENQVGMDFKVQAGQNCNVQASINIEETAGVKHSVSATEVEADAAAMMTNTAGGVLTIQGSLVKINC
jgi:hypothetical protein